MPDHTPDQITCPHPIGQMRQGIFADVECKCSVCGRLFRHKDVIGWEYPDAAKRAQDLVRAMAGLAEGDTRRLLDFIHPQALEYARRQKMHKSLQTPDWKQPEADKTPDPTWGVPGSARDAAARAA